MQWAIALVDGASSGNPGPSGIGGVITLPNGKDFEFSYYIGNGTNNQAEYKALITALNYLLSRDVKKAKIYLDSELVVKQLKGEYKIKGKKLRPLSARASRLIRQFEAIELKYIPRQKNKRANKLAQIASQKAKKNNP